MPLWYISFAMPKAQGGFRGATIVEAPSAEQALPAATLAGLNPGGEAVILPWPVDADPDEMALYLNRLATKREILDAGGKRYADISKKKKASFNRLAIFACSCCNPPRVH